MAHLAQCQAAVDAHANPANCADTLWDSKGGAGGTAAFADIKGQLLGMCVGTEQCNYCEHNEASDIEHIYPKSFYPERAFCWDNYLLACKTCNSGYKLDKFAVFTTPGSAAWVYPKRGHPTPPGEAAFIDPRVDDPLTLLWASFRPDGVYLTPHPDLQSGTREWVKADRTLTILELGTRPTLAKSRLSAYKHYFARLERYSRFAAATTFTELIAADDGLPEVDDTQPFEQEKQAKMAGLKTSIQQGDHPTVWREMVRQHHLRPSSPLGRLFATVTRLDPDIVNW